MTDYIVKVEAVFEADSPEDAVAQFCEWLCAGRRTVTAIEHSEAHRWWASTEHEIEMGWVD